MHRSALLVALAAVGCQSESGLNRLKESPTVQIVSPEAMTELRQGQGLQTFVGLVADEFDAPQELAVTWTLDGEGDPIVGDVDPDGNVLFELDVDELEWGTHQISLTAVDTDGGSDTAILVWALSGPVTSPVVEITDPDDGAAFEPGEEIAFRGNASDLTTPAEDLEFAWASDRDGPLDGAITGGGESAVFSSELSIGIHEITLAVTDTDGEVGFDTIRVSIEDEGVVIDTGETEETDTEIEDPPVEPGDLVFSELMINPSVVADDAGEWVELYNTASYPIDIAGYTFHDLDYDEYVLEGPIVVDGYDFVVLCAEMNVASNGGVPCDAPFKRKSADALALGNGSDEVILSRPDGVVIDEVYYDGDWFTTAVAIGVDPSFLSSADNDDPTHWCNQVSIVSTGGEPGTPGLANDPCF